MRSSRDYVKWEMEKQAALKGRYERYDRTLFSIDDGQVLPIVRKLKELQNFFMKSRGRV